MSALGIIADALRKGDKLHTFRSGGGLRVVRVERGGKPEERGHALVGYGEHPNVEDAFKHAAEDYEAGGIPYKKMYGEPGKARYPHYLTGTTEVTSRHDYHLLRGASVDARWDGSNFIVELHTYDDNIKPVTLRGVAESLREALSRADVGVGL